MPNVTVANPGPHVSIKPNYFHINTNTKKYRMGEDILSLQQATTWHECHLIEGKILGVPCITLVGITQAEHEKALAHVEGTPTTVEVDLLEDSLIAQHNPIEVFLAHTNQIEIAGNIYDMRIDFSSGDFHLSNIPFALIGERFTIELL